MTTHISDLIRLPEGDFEEERVIDLETRTVRTIRRPRESGSNEPARRRDPGYRHLLCQDRGVIDYIEQRPHGVIGDDRTIPYGYVARCYCKASLNVSQSIPQFVDIFGAWPEEPGRQAPPRVQEPEAPKPAGNLLRFPSYTEPPEVVPEVIVPAPSQSTQFTGTQVQDLSDFE